MKEKFTYNKIWFSSPLPVCLFLFVLISPAIAQDRTSLFMQLSPDKSGIGVLSWKNDITAIRNYIDTNQVIGIVNLKYNDAKTKNIAVSTKSMQHALKTNTSNLVELSFDTGNSLEIRETFEKINKEFFWKIILVNHSASAIVVKDLSVILPFGKLDKKLPIADNLSTHGAMIGNASFCYWIPYSGKGNMLVLTPIASTSLEFNNRLGNEIFIHASSAIDKQNDSWRIPSTSALIQANGKKEYGFRLQVADSIEAIRKILYDNGGLDSRIVPGMTVPSDLSVTCAFRSKEKINELVAEYPEQTSIQYIGPAPQNYKLYKIRFKKPGENMVTINYGKSKKAYFNFFSTEPLDVLIKKRSAFITAHQQVRDTSKWYDGLYSIWDMSQQKLLTPDDKGPLPSFVVGGSDDPSNCKPLYISEKNVVYPDKKEIAALEYYERKFVWGGLQHRDDEYPYPYGIYGSENWYENRSGAVASYNSGGWGKERMWRTFDYTTHFAIYYNLYKIAKNEPSSVSYLNAAGYLDRAYHTPMAFFEVPYNIKMVEKWSFHGWTDWAYKQGNFHERYITEIIQALIDNGRMEEADKLRREWEKKVKYFVYNDPWAFGSEFDVDRTAFESTYYVAEYALEHPMKPQEQLWYDKNKQVWYSHLTISDSMNNVLMNNQLNANLALRGVLEPSFNLLGTAWVTHFSLDYMSQMAGVALLDYALKFSDQPAKYVNIGYNSLLSSWALMNTGSAENNYGYWFPGKQNDGAVGWVFTPWQNTTTYFDNIPAKRGIWAYDGEIDHGLVGAIHGSSSIVVNDPVFGVIGYGFPLQADARNETTAIILLDGIRQTLHVFIPGKTFFLRLQQDGFLKDTPMNYTDNLKTISFSIENRQQKEHVSILEFSSKLPGKYEIYVSDKLLATVNENNIHLIRIPVEGTSEKIIIKRIE